MTVKANIQEQTLPSDKVLELLIYFKGFRRMTNRELAEKMRYQETYLSQVLNGHKDGGEKLLHALESFYQLDNLKQIQDIDRKIDDLKREKLVLQEQTAEKFYLERANQPHGSWFRFLVKLLNDRLAKNHCWWARCRRVFCAGGVADVQQTAQRRLHV